MTKSNRLNLAQSSGIKPLLFESFLLDCSFDLIELTLTLTLKIIAIDEIIEKGEFINAIW